MLHSGKLRAERPRRRVVDAVREERAVEEADGARRVGHGAVEPEAVGGGAVNVRAEARGAQQRCRVRASRRRARRAPSAPKRRSRRRARPAVRKMPSTRPSVSTTAIETRALLPSGWRMAARVMFACCAAWPMIVFTSGRQRVGRARGAADEGEEPRVNFARDAADDRGREGRRFARRGWGRASVPGRLPKGIVAGRGRVVHVDEGQPHAVRQDVVAANQRGRLEAAHGRDRDHFFEGLVEVRGSLSSV